jgi:hypothetical protein
MARLRVLLVIAAVFGFALVPSALLLDAAKGSDSRQSEPQAAQGGSRSQGATPLRGTA